MNRLCLLLALVVCLQAEDLALRGVVTDPSGAAIPGATVTVRGPGGEHRTKTNDAGEYSFASLKSGKYQLRVTAKDFSPVQEKSLPIPNVVDVRLSILSDAQVVNVEDGLRRVGTDPGSNGGAVIMREKQIGQLSDDPDELALQLQALAGPAPGPDGGQFYVDGFSGGSLPPKSSIREIRINANPFSPEYDRPGFSRVDVFTKPGSGLLTGQAFALFDDDALNSRNPLLIQSSRPPYSAQLHGLNLSGPLKKNRASFTLDLEHRNIHENALVLATTPDGVISEAVPTPQTRTTVSPRIDYTINPKNTLVARYVELRTSFDNMGVGDFSLPSRAYNQTQSEHTVQITETAVPGPHTVNETRFQFSRSSTENSIGTPAPAIVVQGAFSAGGPTVGGSGSRNNSSELTNLTSYSKGRHTWKWGGRVRQLRLNDTSRNDFSGTFTFYTLAQYEAGRPAQFTMGQGIPATDVQRTDLGLFVNDDWRLRKNLTVSLGMRFENRFDWAPRAAIAWEFRPRTVLRAGIGTFYDRIPLSVKLNDARFNGITQQSYVIFNPDFYPTIPSLAAQPQQLRPMVADIREPLLYQASLGIEQQLRQNSRISLSWIGSRGVHLLNSRNINTPLNGLYPYGDSSVRLLTEDAGLSRQSQLVLNANVNVRKLLLFGYYALSYGRDNNEGQPANPYDLRSEWGPSTYGDVRHRMATGITIPAPWKLSVAPFLVANSGYPYNITTGLDPLLTGFPSARPAFTERNSGRGPANWNMALRVSKTWNLGRETSAAPPSGHDASPGGRHALTLTASTLNALNHPNFAPPDGNLSSPYYGQSRTLGGLIVMSHGGAPTTYNRKIDLQLRYSF